MGKFQMRIPLGTGIDAEQKRQVGIVGIERPLLAQIELFVPRHGGEEGIQQVVAFLIQQAVMLSEEFAGMENLYELRVVSSLDRGRAPQRDLSFFQWKMRPASPMSS